MMREFFQSRKLWIISMTCLFLAAGGAAFAAAVPEEGELSVSVGGKEYVLKRADSDSGDKYVAENDPATVFWSDGKNAGLTIGGREYSRYVLLRNLPDEDMLLLTVDGENFTMKQVISASGAKYEDIEDPTTVFWSKGKSAMLTIRGKDYPGYETWEPDGVIQLTESPDVQ
ncbi:MAG: MliC family protein [Synergistaceae bacterium]|jgi:membrane-bound inhibitor of C-type lysozyme|nr:MliC family protein [Synergistaceae bacterium]